MDWSLLYQDVPTLVGVIVGVPVVLAAYIVGFEFLVRRLRRPRLRPRCATGEFGAGVMR